MAIKSYSTTAGSNDGLGLADEGQAPNTVNDGVRTLMADVRAFYENIEWRDWGHTVTRLSATAFYISGSDETDYYLVGRRAKIVDGTSGTIYGIINAADYDVTRAGDTTVTVTFDSTQMAGTLSSASLGLDHRKNPMVSSVRGFMAYKTSDQAIATGFGSLTGVTYGTETYDTDGAYVPGTGVVTIPTWATKVRWSVSNQFASHATGSRVATIVQLSGTTSFPVPYWSEPGGGTRYVGGTTGFITVTPGNTYRVEVGQDSGGNLNVVGTDGHTSFSAEFAP